jgi:hypothetical protein
VPRLIDQETFDAVQEHLRVRNSKVTPPRVSSATPADRHLLL